MCFRKHKNMTKQHIINAKKQHLKKKSSAAKYN